MKFIFEHKKKKKRKKSESVSSKLLLVKSKSGLRELHSKKEKMQLKNVLIVAAMALTYVSARSLVDVQASPAHVARTLVHKANWTAMGTISTADKIVSYPMVNVVSMADSPLNGVSTGHIYYMLTDLDFTAKDLHRDQRLTALFTEDQDLSCTQNGVDSMEPTCARVIISGRNRILNVNSDEHKFADEAFTSRHPASIEWRRQHNFYLCTLDVEHIVLLDFYGGPKFVTPEEYYKTNPDIEPSVLLNNV